MDKKMKYNASLLLAGENQKSNVSTSTLRFSLYGFLLVVFIFVGRSPETRAQVMYQPNFYTGNPQNNNNYLANSSTFKQEIARVEINVVRQGKAPMSITQVPRLAKDDVLKIRMLQEQVNGMKPDQSNWDWTFLVAFVNPGRNSEREKSVSEEIQFRKTGWYREYSFNVPYDSQPIFFLYTKPKYRAKILSLINENQEDIRKIGEKTIELSGAYAKIGSFLTELQSVINRNQYYNGGSGYGGYGNYGSYGGYGNGIYGNYNTGGTTGTIGANSGFNQSLFIEQSIERLARSFNISLPGCWQNNGYGGYNNGYNNYGNNGYPGSGNYGGYNNGINNNNGGYNNNNNVPNPYGLSNDFIGRAQCVAKSVRLEDFDISVSRMLQQGGIAAAAQLSQKYPQLAFWINVAAVAVDFILKITRKSPLRLMPTVISTTENPAQNLIGQTSVQSSGLNNYNANQSASFTPPNASAMPPNAGARADGAVKISLYAEAPPSENNFVTAYPLVVHKWQASPDPEIISLPAPVLSDACLHAGQNILRSTDLLTDWMADTFTRDFKLELSSPNGFRKEFPLKKNVGLSGWELNLTREDLNAIPKINMKLESAITGRRGFNEIRSPKFEVSLPVGGTWEVAPESQKEFAVGAKRTVRLRNQLGNCRCLQSVVYKPSFGGQFVFEADSRQNPLTFSEDGREVSFEVDATNFQPGAGQLELRQAGGETSNLNVNLYPLPPNITNVKISKGDNRAVIVGERLEQLRAVKINGKRAVVEGNVAATVAAVNQAPIQNNYQPNNYQPNAAPAPVVNQNPYPNMNQPGNQAVQQYTFQNPNQANGAPTPSGSPSGYPNNQVVGGNYPGTSAPGKSQNAPPNQNDSSGDQPSFRNYSLNNQSVNQPVYQPNNQPNSQASYPINNQSSGQTAYPIGNQINNQNVAPSVSGERTVVFEDSAARHVANNVSLELELEGNRTYQYPRSFDVSASRPAIIAGNGGQIDGTAIGAKANTPFDLSGLPIFPIDTIEVSASVQNALTDYDFKIENIRVETRIENSQIAPTELARANFEVLDWKNMRISFPLDEQTRHLLGGRRLQFRISDKTRGDSDWYTLRGTFTRLPESVSVKCASGAKADCQLNGKGIEYISQISTDGGKTWFPQTPATLSVQATADGGKTATIPNFSNRKLLRIRLRDFPVEGGLAFTDYTPAAMIKTKNP